MPDTSSDPYLKHPLLAGFLGVVLGPVGITYVSILTGAALSVLWVVGTYGPWGDFGLWVWAICPPLGWVLAIRNNQRTVQWREGVRARAQARRRMESMGDAVKPKDGIRTDEKGET